MQVKEIWFLILTDQSHFAIDEKGGNQQRWTVIFRSTETKAIEVQKDARKYRQRKCLIIKSIVKLITLSLLMNHFLGTQAVLQGGGSYVGRI